MTTTVSIVSGRGKRRPYEYLICCSNYHVYVDKARPALGEEAGKRNGAGDGHTNVNI